MTGRNPHPDNALIDALTDGETPAQGSSAGGSVKRDVGKRSELHRATDPDNREPVVGSDNPAEDAKKVDKIKAAIQANRQS